MGALRTRFVALAAGALMAVTAGGTAAAQTGDDDGAVEVQTSTNPGSVYQTSDNFCHFANWGGNWYCLGTGVDLVDWTKPDGYPEVFVIGTDQHMWTRWSSPSGTSNWLDMGGVCNPRYGLPAKASGWTITIACVGTDNAWWHDSRDKYGHWTGFVPGKGF